MFNRVVLVVPILLLGLVLVYSANAREAAPPERREIGFSVASVAVDDRTLVIDIPSCGAKPSASVEVGGDEIVITAEINVQSGPDLDGCLDELWVELEEPLAGRRVIDGTSGLAVATERNSSSATDLDPESIFGAWELTEIDGEPLHPREIDPRPIYLTLSALPVLDEIQRSEGYRRIGGSGGCNGFGGGYRVVDGRLQATGFTTTLRGCGSRLVQQDLTMQEVVRDAVITADRWKLTLQGANGVTVVLRRGHRPSGTGSYRVESVNGDAVDLDAVLEVGLDRYVAFVGCFVTGTVDDPRGVLVFDDQRLLGSGNSADADPQDERSSCLDGNCICGSATELESTIRAGLESGTAEVDNDRLVMTGPSGTVIVFRHA